MTITTARSTAIEIIKTIMCGLSLRHGCTADETGTIRVTQHAGSGPCLGSVRAGDGREIIRFGSLAELDAFISDRNHVAMVAKEIRRACKACSV